MAASSDLSVGLCSFLMASLFALSTSFQFNDPDWYFWIPLYSTACVVNLINGLRPKVASSMRKWAKFGLWLGIFLFVKVSMEDFVNGIARFWSLDMRERVVRERFGSGLVLSSMFLHLENSSSSNPPSQIAKYGMPMVVVVGYGLSFIFFVFQHEEMRF